jgi:hypothetical protein
MYCLIIIRLDSIAAGNVGNGFREKNDASSLPWAAISVGIVCVLVILTGCYALRRIRRRGRRRTFLILFDKTTKYCHF